MSSMKKSAIYSDNEWGNEVSPVSSISVDIISSSKLISAPVENGFESFDNKVNNPRKVIVSGIIEIGAEGWEDAVGKIEKMIANRKFEFYSVCDGVTYLNNIMLQNYKTTRDRKEFDFYSLKLEFLEILLVNRPSVSSNVNSENTDFRENGYIAT